MGDKKRRIMVTVLVIVLIVAMVLPTIAYIASSLAMQ